MSALGAAPPHDLQAEEAVLGAILLSPAKVLPVLLTEVGLEAGHFYREAHGGVYHVATRLHAEGEPVDALTIRAGLEAQGAKAPDDLEALAAAVPSVAHVRAYADRVRDLAVLRVKREGALEVLEGVHAQDRERIAGGQAKIAREDGRGTATHDPEAVRTLLWDYFDRESPEVFPFPFDRLNQLTAGGMRRGQVTLVGGWTSHGKSVLLDQVLSHAAIHRDLRAHLYINEMTAEERAVRWLSRESGLDYGRALQGKAALRAGEEALIVEALGRGIPFGITDAVALGGSIEATAHHVRANGWDLVGVDILHLYDHDEERDLARISRTLKRLAIQANCHVVATVHLNEKRIVGAVRPAPTTGDIRGSGMLKNDADNVLFVYRDQTDDGTELLPEGRVYFAKARAGLVAGMPVTYEGKRMRFLADLQA